MIAAVKVTTAFQNPRLSSFYYCWFQTWQNQSFWAESEHHCWLRRISECQLDISDSLPGCTKYSAIAEYNSKRILQRPCSQVRRWRRAVHFESIWSSITTVLWNIILAQFLESSESVQARRWQLWINLTMKLNIVGWSNNKYWTTLM